jgi:D-alanyl-D-alanine carboxypeptidase
MRLFGICLAASIAAALPGVSFASSGTLPEAPQLEAVVASALQTYAVPGAAIGVWTPNGHWIMASGLADVASGTRVRRNDHFGIRSITKSFTVTLVLQLVAASNGAISLDDPISKYLQGVPDGDAITLRQLANMTSGLFNYTASRAFQQVFITDLTRAWTPDELLWYAFNDPSHKPVNFSPGSRFEYSNTNTLLLGKFVEAVTGKPFAEVLAEKILDPLNLAATAFLSGTTLPSPASHGYQGETEDGVPDDVVINLSALSFAGAMATTLHDLAEWGRALAQGTLLPGDLQSQRFIARPTASDPASPIYDSYGLGIGEVAGWWGHTGEALGFEAAVFHQPVRDETFVVLLNASNAHDVPVRIFCEVLAVLGESPAATSGSVCVPGSDLDRR